MVIFLYNLFKDEETFYLRSKKEGYVLCKRNNIRSPNQTCKLTQTHIVLNTPMHRISDAASCSGPIKCKWLIYQLYNYRKAFSVEKRFGI